MRRVDPLSVKCPHCGAGPYLSCIVPTRIVVLPSGYYANPVAPKEHAARAKLAGKSPREVAK